MTGVHHVTGITSGAQANVDFHAGLLGLGLVKRTVNLGDPGVLSYIGPADDGLLRARPAGGAP